jgi:hypothetical protein
MRWPAVPPIIGDMTKQSKVHELEQIADAGESERTPAILLGEVWVVTAIAVIVVTAVTLIAYRLAF